MINNQIEFYGEILTINAIAQREGIERVTLENIMICMEIFI